MYFDFPRALRTSAYIVAVGSALAACGGGNGGVDTESTPTQASSSASTQPGNTDIAASVVTSTASSNTAPVVDSAPVAAPVTTDASAPPTPDTTIASADVQPQSVAPAISVPKAGISAKAPRSGAGMNLAPLDPTSTEFPTIDLMKRAGGWLTQCASWTSATCKDFAAGQSAWDTREESKLNVDAQGWIKSLPANTRRDRPSTATSRPSCPAAACLTASTSSSTTARAP